jgi:hypothetical protein
VENIENRFYCLSSPTQKSCMDYLGSSADRDAANDVPIAPAPADETLSIQQQRLRLPVYANREEISSILIGINMLYR